MNRWIRLWISYLMAWFTLVSNKCMTELHRLPTLQSTTIQPTIMAVLCDSSAWDLRPTPSPRLQKRCLCCSHQYLHSTTMVRSLSSQLFPLYSALFQLVTPIRDGNTFERELIPHRQHQHPSNRIYVPPLALKRHIQLLEYPFHLIMGVSRRECVHWYAKRCWGLADQRERSSHWMRSAWRRLIFGLVGEEGSWEEWELSSFSFACLLYLTFFFCTLCWNPIYSSPRSGTNVRWES